MTLTVAKLLTRLRLGLSPIQELKFARNFQVTLNTLSVPLALLKLKFSIEKSNTKIFWIFSWF